MAVLTILRYPDPKLAETSEPVGDDVASVAELVQNMAETMYAAHGAGLAAIQVGEAKRVFIVESEIAGLKATDPPMAFIDPEILELSDEQQNGDEGCLSFPGIFVPIKRSMRCRVRAKNLAGELFEVEGEGLFARAMQHEYDHLDGTLITDHVGKLKRKMIARRMAREK